MDRWRSLFLVLLFWKKSTLKWSPAVVKIFRIQLRLCAELYTRFLYDSGPKHCFFLFQILVLEKHRLLLHLCFVHLSRCHFIPDVVFIYCWKHLFNFMLACTWFESCVVFFLHGCLSLFFLSGEGLEFKKTKNTRLFISLFIFKCTHFLDASKRGNILIIFSVYFCTNIYGKKKEEVNNRCV